MTLISDSGEMALDDRPAAVASVDDARRPAESSSSPTTEQISPTKEKKVGQIRAVHDLIAGGVAGSASVVVGHPFDTIKVRMQVASPTSASGGGGGGGIQSFGGVSSLFRGIGAPLSTAAVVNAIIFASYGATSRLWDAYYHIPHDEEEEIHGVVAG